MVRFDKDKRIVMTLDAGGTNLVFSAIAANEEIVEPITLPTEGNNLQKCLANITEGFKQVKAKLKKTPAAISFAFPGPADYPNGIIGDLGNLPGFRGGVALGPMLKDKFKIPVCIGNDGDLFVYGEAIAGLLPKVNDMLKKAGSPKRYKNLLGVTLGTGFGCGIVSDGKLLGGDNSAAAEIWLMRNKVNNKCIAEEGVSIRAIRNEYAKIAGIEPDQSLSPKDIFEIAKGKKGGNKIAAQKAFCSMADVLADALANANTLIDGLIVIGGGLSGAAGIFLPEVVKQMNGSIEKTSGEKLQRLVMKVYNLEDKKDLKQFCKGQVKEIKVPGCSKKMLYDPQKRTAIGLSILGTSKATAIGAYAFALDAIDSI